MSNEQAYSLEISDNEIILRAAFRPFNARKMGGKIKLNLFTLPQKKLDELSCMRSSIMSISECFEKAKKIAGKDKEFHGFALITNSCANDASPPNEDGMVYIKDSRSYFLGHADLIIGIKAPAEDEPLSCLDKEKFDSVRNNLYNHSVFVTQNGITVPNNVSCNKNDLLANFAKDVLNILETCKEEQV